MSALMESAFMEWLVHAYLPLAARYCMVAHETHAFGTRASERDPAARLVA
jgi:hypothetical protein